MFYEYASDAYALFLAGDDAAVEALNARLEEAFRQRCADAASERETSLSRRDAALAKIASLKDAAASLSKAIDARSKAEALCDKAARDADEDARDAIDSNDAGLGTAAPAPDPFTPAPAAGARAPPRPLVGTFWSGGLGASASGVSLRGGAGRDAGSACAPPSIPCEPWSHAVSCEFARCGSGGSAAAECGDGSGGCGCCGCGGCWRWWPACASPCTPYILQVVKK